MSKKTVTVSLAAIMRVAEVAVVKRFDADAPDYYVVFDAGMDVARIHAHETKGLVAEVGLRDL